MTLGLSSRRFPRFFPGFLGLYAGDTLWAMLVYLGILFLHPSSSVGLRPHSL